MDSDQIDTINDPGRKESEHRLKNKMSSKYLDEVIEKTGMDYDEAVEAIEREKAARDAMADGTASSYGTDLDTEKIDWAARRMHTLPTRPKPAVIERSKGFGEAREAEKGRVKQVLGAGKRVSEGETEGKKGGEMRQVVRFQSAELEQRVKLVQKGVKKMCEDVEKKQ